MAYGEHYVNIWAVLDWLKWLVATACLPFVIKIVSIDVWVVWRDCLVGGLLLFYKNWL